jgi:molybdopterin synthase catalytic subunit
MIQLTLDTLDPEAIATNMRSNSNGAVVTFLGTTRDSFEGKKVLRLEYEAYEDMAIRKLGEVKQEAQNEFQIENISICHRIGLVEIGEISLVVVVASPHRKEAFLACQKIVDRVKEIVPIWKKEVFEGGSHWVSCEDHEFETPTSQQSL